MTTWIAVSKTDHLQKFWKPREGFAFTKEMQVVPIAISELSKLLPHYCIAFVKDEDRYQAVVLLGLGEVKNAYLNSENKWLATYVPENLRPHPFILGNTDDDKKVLCVSAAHLCDEGEHRLFDPNGELTKDTAEMLELLNQRDLNNEGNRNACKLLDDAGLIVDWELTVKTSDTADNFQIQGLFKLDEHKLNQLEPEDFAKLRESGALLLAYAHLFSLSQIDQISQRIEYSRTISSAAKPADLEGIFSDEGTLNLDSLNFD
jgi:hypothetical protein